MANVIGTLRVVDAGRGFNWWGDGWRILRSGFWTWIGITVIYILLSLVIAVIPFVGGLGHSLLTPVFVGGLMLGCRALDRDAPLRVSHLFEGFQGTHFVPLLLIGVVNIAVTFGLVAILAGGMLGGMHLSELANLGSGADPLAGMDRAIGSVGAGGLLVGLLSLVIAALLAMLNWFAPALVVLQGVTAIDAMKRSFVACWRNFLPFLLYGLVAIGMWIALILLLGAIAVMVGVGAIAGSNSGHGGMLGALVGFGVLFVGVLLLLALVVGPIVIGSLYAGYKDIFEDTDVTLPNPLP